MHGKLGRMEEKEGVLCRALKEKEEESAKSLFPAIFTAQHDE